jgi:uncharacterized membrane protein
MCSTCGATLNEGVAFCPFCGTPQTTATTSGGTPPQAWAPGPQGLLPPNIAGALANSLGFITGIIFLKIDPYRRDPFVRFHAFQAIFLFIFYMMVFAAWHVFMDMLFTARVGSAWILIPILYFRYYVLRVAIGALQLFLIYKAFRGDRFSLPIIGPLAAAIAG